MNTENQMPASPTAAAPAESVGIFSIIVGVFTSPTQAFENFKQRPSVWMPLVVLLLLSTITAIGMTKYNAIEQYEAMKTSTALPPQALEGMRDGIDNPNYVMAAIATPVVIMIVSMIAALLAKLFGGFIFGGQAKYWHVFGVAVLAGLISSLGNLIKLPLVMSKGSVHVSFGLAAVMPVKSFTSFLYGLLYFLDGFAIWGIIVAGIGYGIIFGIKKSQGLTTSIITSLVMILLMVGLQFLGFAVAGVDVSFM